MERDKDRDSGFGLRFRLLLGYHNLALKDVSEVTGAAISTISTWRNGRVPGTRAVIEKIAQLFHVSPSYLLQGETPQSDEVEVDKTLLEIAHQFSKNSNSNDGNLREKIRLYFERYLDEAEKYEGGLEHTWLQLAKEFPINWFQNAGEFLTLRHRSETENVQPQDYPDKTEFIEVFPKCLSR
ncbi:MAG: helix-turn-helix domain-containing protein [Puniceicoccales bacterium]|nr:helix-turn-helix domain-containing protein [Puniceicoccales bacterium]